MSQILGLNRQTRNMLQIVIGVIRTLPNIYDGAAKIVNGKKALTIFSKRSIIDVSQGPKTSLRMVRHADTKF